MTVTIEDELWKEMKKRAEIRWSAVMKEEARRKLEALKVLDRFTKESKLSEKEIEKISIELGRKINNTIATKYKNSKKK